MRGGAIEFGAAHTQLEALQSGRLTSEELTRLYLDRAEQAGALGVYLEVDRGRALNAAAETDRLRRAGHRAPLLGLPLAIKDNLCTQGIKTTCASRALEGFVPGYDATVVARLQSAGAFVLGKTNMDEFAMGSSNENSAFKPVLNPWDPTRVPGGSSGGSAAAVSAGLASAALGSDTGGSIRQPAGLCGVVGLKPTWGRVSRSGLIAFASSLDQVGPITRDVRDAGLFYELMAGPDPADSTTLSSAPAPVLPDLEAGVSGLRVGLLAEGLSEGVAPEVRAAFEQAGRQLESAGAHLVPVGLPNAEYAVSIYYLIATAEASSNLARFDGVRYGRRAAGAHQELEQLISRSRGSGFGREVKRRILLGTYALSAGYYDAYYNRAQALRKALVADLEAAFEVCDVILGPVAPTTAFALGTKVDDPLEMYLSDVFTIPANLAGVPAMSLPVGLDALGLPIAMQLTAPRLAEALLLRAARALEREVAFEAHPPEGWRRPS